VRDLLQDLERLRERITEVPQADAKRLQELKTELLGRKAGALTDILKQLPALDPEQRKAVGGAANVLKRDFEAAITAREQALAGAARVPAGVDLTMPGRRQWRGGLHLTTQVINEICGIFAELGFSRAVGPEVETERTNFFALNFPKDHPALDAQDSFYLGGDALLRTHTSPVQVRTLEAYRPPIRVVIPGRVYRRDPFDASHAPEFEQIEGLVVDEGITFVDLKAALTTFARRFFSPTTRVRFRPSFFPFTEPSAEMDVQHPLCRGTGCPTCKQTGWMEILGSGMVHPNVLQGCGVDPERYTGFAFGMGPERIAMSRHGIPDIRLLSEGDVRFLTQFARGEG
jgi:phenylalanyl-tRNA synthetase alpha chain